MLGASQMAERPSRSSVDVRNDAGSNAHAAVNGKHGRVTVMDCERLFIVREMSFGRIAIFSSREYIL